MNLEERTEERRGRVISHMMSPPNSDQNPSQLLHLSLRVVGARGVEASFHGRMERPNAREIAALRSQ